MIVNCTNLTPALRKLLLLIFLIISISGNGQEKPKASGVSNTSGQSPTVIKNFKTTPVAPDFDTTLVSQYIRSIFQDSRGNLWFGTIAEGVVRYDKKTLTYFSNPDGFNTQSVFAINEDKQGNLWFGTDNGVYKYDGKTFRNYNQKDGLTSIEISRKSILVDKSGGIWVGTHHGVFLYQPSEDRRGGQSFSLFRPLSDINVAGILEDRNGNIWFASQSKGVFRYDGKTITPLGEKNAVGQNYAGGIAQDRAGNMWFTMANGICKYDGKAFTEYTAKDGLRGNEFWGIYIEQSGIIWVTTRGGTTRFDPSFLVPTPKAFTTFTVSDGINCCVQSMYQDRSGNMWWGTGQGLYRFDGKGFYQVKQKGPW